MLVKTRLLESQIVHVVRDSAVHGEAAEEASEKGIEVSQGGSFLEGTEETARRAHGPCAGQ